MNRADPGRRSLKAPLVHGPTPFEPMSRVLSGRGVSPLFVKREDCSTFAMGGNKVRQVERYVDEAIRQDSTILLVSGAVQSNFVRVVAAAAARFGLGCEILLEDRVRGVPSDYYETGNVLLDRLFGAAVRIVPEGTEESAVELLLETRRQELAASGARPYVISTGLDAPPLGALGYVGVAREILDQAEVAGVEPTDIVVATGTGYTHAGLLVGLRALGNSARVHGIAVRRKAAPQRARVRAVARATEELSGLPERVSFEDVQVDDSFLAPGYGRVSQEVGDAVRLAATREGLLLDPVYSGRAFAGLLARAKRRELDPGATVFVHTGGAPALFAYPNIASAGRDRPMGGPCFSDIVSPTAASSVRSHMSDARA